jgi:hypothetical protein
MAFRRTSADLPKDVEFPADLAKLDFKVNADGRIVEIHNAKEFFKFEKYDKYDTNQRRYNAMHQAVRAKAHKILASMGIAPVYIDLTDDMKSHHVGGKKPVAPSMKILASPGFSQFDDKELYLIIGDSKQDLGIWSRKTVLTEGGIEHGSAIGLVAALRGIAQPTKVENSPLPKDKESNLPGVIILNPGELLYSHKDKDNMSAATWHDRQREHAFAHQYKITEEHNLLPGHQTPGMHAKLFLRGFLKPVIGYRTRVNIITIGDASEAVLECLNEDFNVATAKDDLIAAKLTIAMIQPTHNVDIVTNPALQNLLAKHGRIWEAHSSPKGTLLADVARDDGLSGQLESDLNDVFVDQSIMKRTSSDAGTFDDTGPITNRLVEDLGSVRQIVGAVPDTPQLALAEPADDAAPDGNLALVHVEPTEDIKSAGEDKTKDTALDPYSRRADYKQTVVSALAIHHSTGEETPTEGSTPLASHCDPVTAEWIKNGSFDESKGNKNKSTAPGTQLAQRNDTKQIEGAEPTNAAHTDINRWIKGVESFEGAVDANTALATKPSSLEDKQSDGETLAPPTTPETPLRPVVVKPSESESESDDTPPGEFTKRNNPVDYFRGKGLAMAITKRPATVAEPVSNKVLEESEENVAVDEHGPSTEPVTMKKISAGDELKVDHESEASQTPDVVAEHTASNEPVTVVKARPHNQLEIGKVGITLASAPISICTHAISQPIPIPSRAKETATQARTADSDKHVAVADAKKTDHDDHDAKKTNDHENTLAYPYHEALVNCPTYSAGIEDTTEMIFPAVMQDVVEFFREQKKRWG